MKRGKLFRSIRGKVLQTTWDSPLDRDKLYVSINSAGVKATIPLDVSQVDQLCGELAAWSHAKKIEKAMVKPS